MMLDYLSSSEIVIIPIEEKKNLSRISSSQTQKIFEGNHERTVVEEKCQDWVFPNDMPNKRARWSSVNDPTCMDYFLRDRRFSKLD